MAVIPLRAAPPSSDGRRLRTILIPLLLVVIFLAEVSFLGRLDMAKNADMMYSWTESFYSSSSSSSSFRSSSLTHFGIVELGPESCEELLEREDAVPYTRDFNIEPIWILGGEKEYKSCAVPCIFGPGQKAGKKADAAFGRDPGADNHIVRSMESSHYYPDLNIVNAKRKGYSIVMTTSLSSDVPVGYFSWAEYDIMAPVQPKTEKAIAAAFISNCGARNFRLEALNMLEKDNISIDSYGACHRNKDGNVNKVETLKKYKFSLAFENSNEEDYVTEKYFQALVAGTIPVVIGPPNILEFAPSPGSVLHIKSLDDIPSVSKTMKYLAANPQAYDETLRWKFDGPSDSFKALVDMAAVHSSCRLCIYLATKVQDKEERSNPSFQKRPCKCMRRGETVYHLFVRERGSFNMKSIFLRSSNITLQALESAVFTKFKSENHIPLWKEERPEVLRKYEYKVYRIYPVGLTQRQALYTFKFNGDADFRQFVESHPCGKLEVIFV